MASPKGQKTKAVTKIKVRSLKIKVASVVSEVPVRVVVSFPTEVVGEVAIVLYIVYCYSAYNNKSK